jgi:Flp pilus assembly protein TadG
VRRIRDERGASAVEFAIIASLLLLILFGTITFGIAFNRIQGLQSAAREGARLGSLSQTTVDQISSRTLESVSILNASNFQTGGGGGSVRWCSGALTFDTGCMTIQTKQDLNGDDDYADSGEVTTWTTGGDAPCGSAVPNSKKTLIVEVDYRIKIEIPFWASPQMTAAGTGEFACEKQS